MGFFDSLGELVGEVVMAPVTVTKGIVDGMGNAIERITDD